MDDMTVAQQIVADVLALRGPAEGGNVFMRGIDPEHIAPERLRLVKRFGHMVPAGTSIDDIDQAARGIVPFLKSDRAGQSAAVPDGSGRPFLTT